jgi:hypothetical protein
MRITNIVVQGDLGCRIDLKQLVLKLSNVRYDHNRFSGIIWQQGNNFMIPSPRQWDKFDGCIVVSNLTLPNLTGYPER